MRSGVPPDAGKAQESLLEAVVVILVDVPAQKKVPQHTSEIRSPTRSSPLDTLLRLSEALIDSTP